MSAAGISASRQFWAAVLTSVPQPIGAVIAYVLVEEISALLPISFAFAAGAMLALVAVEVIPSALHAAPGVRPLRGWKAPPLQTLIGAVAGALVMVALSLLLGV